MNMIGDASLFRAMSYQRSAWTVRRNENGVRCAAHRMEELAGGPKSAPPGWCGVPRMETPPSARELPRAGCDKPDSPSHQVSL